jgi:AcrR family transcriptional regulator
MPRDERRALLLAAAQRVFVANGYHNAGMDEIAEQAGVSKPVLYQHFRSKLELYQALLERQVGHMLNAVRTAIAATPGNRSRVHAAVGAYFDFVDEDGEAFRLVFESDLRGEPAVQGIAGDAQARCVDAIAQAVIADAGLAADRARLLAVGVVGLSQITATHWLENKRSIPKTEAIGLVAQLAWKGLSGFPLQAQA